MMDVSRLKYRVEVLGDSSKITRYGPFNEQKAREFFEVEESLGGTARIVRLEEEGIQQRWEVLTECGDWDRYERGHRAKKKVEVPL